MDSHEIPLALVEKLQDLLSVRFGFLRTLQLRYCGGVRAQNVANRHTGDSHHPCDLPFAHLLRIQFQNRGALRLTQHAVSSPVGFLRLCDGVAFQCAQSGVAWLRIADDPALSPLRPPVAAARGSQWRPPSPDRATVRPRRELSPESAAAL